MSRTSSAAVRSTKNLIKKIVKTTGLPSEIWSPSEKLSIPTIDGYGFELVDRLIIERPSLDEWPEYRNHRIKVGTKTITTLARVPAANILGYATIIRTSANLTAMVSLAEAAAVSMNESHCQLLWVMMQFIEMGIRSGKDKFHARYEGYEAVSEVRTAETPQQPERQIPLHRTERKPTLLFDAKQQQPRKPINSKKKFHREFSARSQDRQEKIKPRPTLENDNGSWNPLRDRLIDPKLLDRPKSLSKARSVSTGLDRNKGAGTQAVVPDSIPTIKAPSEPIRNYSEHLYFSRTTQELLCPWAFSERDRTDHNVFKYLAEWLELHLGGAISSAPTLPNCIELQMENPIGKVSKSQIKRGCWRDKIISGNIFQFESTQKEESSRARDLIKIQDRFRHFIENDCLLLTGAALWSLFDNALERLPNCQCTFKTNKDFLQCRSIQDGWFIWHTWSSTTEALCQGENCDENIRIALSEEEAGHQFRSTSPCALGWFATDRETPCAIIWDKLSPSPEFKKNFLVKYKVKEFQIQAQLSVPLAVAPQICGAVTFAKDSYIIANSIDSASAIATELAAAAVLLIHDEKRGVHRTFDRADLIEMCCMQLLRDIGYHLSGLPYFSGRNAFLRLETWRHSNFVTFTKKLFTGDQLVRQATRRISEVIDATRTAARDNSTLLYWALEDILRTGSSQALKSPRCQDTSWHKLAFAAPPIILVVGELKPEIFEANCQSVNWHDMASISTRNSFLKVLSLCKGQSFSEIALDPTVNKIVCDQLGRYRDIVYNVVPVGTGKKADPNDLFWGCLDSRALNWEGRCLHYIQ
ncbi:hypothetical protein TWF102_002745 [Orbilia oligospora]|uniref:Uncharacterized protein n=1 Tax=Orbilia oligospora TaxID=2813651 RepID=A0A7C8J9W6_ORBOL|nr:hypothetical protein TWF102_002745 [Orbilia oligospora]